MLNIEQLIDKGALMFFFVVVLWIVFKYLNIRFNAMKMDIERELKSKRLHGSGNFKIDGEPTKSGSIDIDFNWGVSSQGAQPPNFTPQPQRRS